MWSPDLKALLCRTFPARDHWRRRSTHTIVVSGWASESSRSASARSVARQNASSLRWPPSVSPISVSGSCARIRTCACATVAPSCSKALKVIQPANMCPCGVMNVNDSSSA